MSSRPRLVETAPLDAALAAIEQAIRETPAEGLPDLAAGLAGLSARVSLRLAGNPAARSPAGPERLLTAGEVAEVLRISEGSVYARARQDLKPAAVQLGPGTLRFSSSGIQRFIRARTG